MDTKRCAAFGHDPACSGQGRPSCTAAECIVGIAECPVCGQLQGVGATCDHRRAAFEAWISAPPIEASTARWDADRAFPGQYVSYDVQLAWEAWEAASGPLQAEVAQLRQDAERERLARRLVDEALRQALTRQP